MLKGKSHYCSPLTTSFCYASLGLNHQTWQTALFLLHGHFEIDYCFVTLSPFQMVSVLKLYCFFFVFLCARWSFCFFLSFLLSVFFS